jgi:undecaprenyl-diphosphatase
MNFIDAGILGIVEGLTEFLPVSSTGHLILASHVLAIPQTELLKTFDIAIQLGAICAVLVLYFKSFLNIQNLKKIIIAFIPTAVIGLVFYNVVKNYLLDNELVVLLALLVGGIAIIVFEKWHKERDDDVASIEGVSTRQALGIGLVQSISIIPGVSRSATTILGGLMLGLKRIAIVEFSFLLAVPVMISATGLDLMKNYSLFSKSDIGLIAVGFITAFIVAILVIKIFLKYVRTQNFIPFGIYRIVVAILFYFVFLS